MGRIVSSVAASLDGFNADPDGGFDWAFPSQEVMASLVDDLADTTGILMGRRMYELMSGCETDPSWAEGSSSGSST
jgi:dihydrofolate reductase